MCVIQQLMHFGPNTIVTRPTISRILQLGDARKRKIIKQDKHDTMKRKKVGI